MAKLSATKEGGAGKGLVRIVLRALPGAVYKLPTLAFQHRGGEEEWSFWLQAFCAGPASVRRLSGRIRLYSGRKLVEDVSAPAAFWASRVVPAEQSGRPGLYYLRMRAPVAAGVDRVTIGLDVTVGRERHARRLSVPVLRYRPPVAMHVPLEGGVFVMTDHRARHGAEAGWFALDLLGLSAGGRHLRRDPPRRPSDFCGGGRRVLAPAGGVVVRTGDGMPDHGKLGETAAKRERLRMYARRDWFLFGNHVVLCHGRRLFSLLAHLERGSVAVAPGQKVKAGEALGRLGNSGLSRMPHLHFQLMSGADAFGADPVPTWFDGVRIPPWGRFRRAVLHAGMTAFAI
jgi:hypothetical protein